MPLKIPEQGSAEQGVQDVEGGINVISLEENRCSSSSPKFYLHPREMN